MGWRHHTDTSAGEVHVWPEADLAGHVTEDSIQCWCMPDIEVYDDGRFLIVHRDQMDRERTR